MKKGFYYNLAKDGIRKNKKIYLPYIVACSAMVVLYFIMSSLSMQEGMKHMRGGAPLAMMLNLGSTLIAAFSCLFLFYVNSFLMKRRKKEFGLYHILGMGKKHISKVLAWEYLMISGVSIVAGIVIGGVLAKFAELGLYNMIKADIDYSFSLSIKSVTDTIMIFGILYFVLFLNAARQIYFTTTVSLLVSDKAGEKPPKANWLFGIGGIGILGAAYYIAATIQNPVAALQYFFIAVLMVLVGTYLLFVASSVVLCKILQKRKKYYYKTNHFVSISSMLYRMKRNGAGLAAICILATMVLVMVSSTSCLYIGTEDVMRTRYPRQICLGFLYEDGDLISSDQIDTFKQELHDAAATYGCEITDDLVEVISVNLGFIKDDKIAFPKNKDAVLSGSVSDMIMLNVESIDQYNKVTGENIVLGDQEIVLYSPEYSYSYDHLSIDDCQEFKVVKYVEKVPKDLETAADVVPTITLYVTDMVGMLESMGEAVYHFQYGFENHLPVEEQYDFLSYYKAYLMSEEFLSGMSNSDMINCSSYGEDYDLGSHFEIECRDTERAGFYEDFGGLFYLGIVLSIVFIFATVLIIYYKQISEGYEDQSRFEIMQKVGMTRKEIKNSINSQMLTVFFFPLLVAGIHVCFAFPIIRKLLILFALNNVKLFAITSLTCFAIFALFYMIVYKMTSNAYYKIVTGMNDK